MFITHGQSLPRFRIWEAQTSDLDKHHAILTLREMDGLRQQIEEGVKILRNGGVVAFPTDTVYGLGSDAFNIRAVERIYEIKSRPRHQQFPLLVADGKEMTTLAEPVPRIAWFLAGRFWPGGLTLVLSKTNVAPAYLASGPTIAVRVPDHPVCLALIKGLGNPLIGTSANISGQPAGSTAEEVDEQLKGKIDLVINGGKCPGGKESTVVDVTHEPPTILREGIIPSHEISRAYREYLEAE
jgi:L-threonylcarbamoyladenylate synthase